MGKSEKAANPPPEEVQPGGLIAHPSARHRAGHLAASRSLHRNMMRSTLSGPRRGSSGKPMTFICQIDIPADWHTKSPARMAYVFMTGGGFDYDSVETWNPDDGETAVNVQKALAAPPAAEPYPDTLKHWEEVDGRRTEIPHEYAVEQTPVEDSSYPFNLNLGDGVGYVFLDVACTEGKLLWQC